jgi:hypothetical protein
VHQHSTFREFLPRNGRHVAHAVPVHLIYSFLKCSKPSSIFYMRHAGPFLGTDYTITAVAAAQHSRNFSCGTGFEASARVPFQRFLFKIDGGSELSLFSRLRQGPGTAACSASTRSPVPIEEAGGNAASGFLWLLHITI